MPQFNSHIENAEFVDQLYQQYLDDPSQLDTEWRAFFKGFDLGYSQTGDSISKSESFSGFSVTYDQNDLPQRQHTDRGVFALVQAYRTFGHFIAKLDPLGQNRKSIALLDLSEFGLSENDLEKGNDFSVKVNQFAFNENTECIKISAQVESELVDLDIQEKMDYLNDLGVKEGGLSSLIKATYKLSMKSKFLRYF